MAEKKTYLSSSPIFRALNNIVPIRRSASTMRSTQSSFQGFLRFMDVEVTNLQGIKLPSKRKLKEISNINVASTFGRPGNLLSAVASGALDAAGLVGNMFGGGRGSKSAKPPKVVPTKGPMVKLGGLKALGIANAIFAGLDFATGLAEGESAGKAAAGAGGALAGSMLGGAIGQALIPVPGLGFVVGSMAGNFLGGYLADRGYEAARGLSGNEPSVKEKAKEKLKQQEAQQKAQAAAAGSTLSMTEVLNKFDSVVARFENYASGSQTVQVAQAEEVAPPGTEPPVDPGSGASPGSGKTVVIAYGTNDYASPQVVEKNTELMVKTAKNKGYNVVVVPPNPVAYRDAYEASVRAAQSGGASIESAKYEVKDPLHLEPNEASRIRGKYNDAEFIGDSNAIRIAGGGPVPGKRVVGARGTAVLQFIGGLPKAPTGTPSGSGANLAATAAKMKGFSSRSGPRGGREACVWAVNKVFAAAGIRPPWGTSEYAPDAEKAMIKAGWQQVPENQRQAGDIYISYDRGSPPQIHIGIVLVNGNILSNSSTGAKFSWEGSPADYYAEYGGVKGKFYRMPGGGVQIQKSGPNSSDINATANAIKPQQQSQSSGMVTMATPSVQPQPQQMNVANTVPMQNVMAGPTPSAQLNYPMQYEMYPDYNVGGQSSVLIMPMIMSSGESSQRPMIVSSGGGGGGTVIMPPPPQGVLLNSLFKTMLLTNLSAM